MKLLLALVPILLGATSVLGSEESVNQLLLLSSRNPDITTWEQFKQVFQKTYSSEEEEATRKENFEKSLKYVTENRDKVKFELGINEFSDLSQDELYSANSTLEQLSDEEYQPNLLTKFNNLHGSASSLERFDWLDAFKSNPPMKQGPCGSCWAIASVSAVEGAVYAKNRTRIILSKQQVIDCAHSDVDPQYKFCRGCTGGNAAYAMRYMKNTGLYKTTKYQAYAADTRKCEFNSTLHQHNHDIAYKIRDYKVEEKVKDARLMDLLQKYGPIVISTKSDKSAAFQNYKGGVITDLNRDAKDTDHSMLLVGWGKAKSKDAHGKESWIDHWLIRNSWGESWGIGGHCMVERGKNMMGLNRAILYPIV